MSRSDRRRTIAAASGGTVVRPFADGLCVRGEVAGALPVGAHLVTVLRAGDELLLHYSLR
ncbi:hypothetical protein FVO59_08465 [Microbacterium esteraromaticum]|uniref:Uncharacterized protein n=1 Tax=Microbacterium esteraromaticum TaxID=57043 RepID=A0A7D8AJN5_9MICO|nr:hypothetical protein [Microbacterium esteraromaticum]QMU97246.1 hypothetical protein FVO59_08465 [Microbacterium esteraromaticum]